VSTARVLWLIWCLAWAGFWVFLVFATLGFSLILAAGSVAAFWIPVGVERRPQLPPPGSQAWVTPQAPQYRPPDHYQG
jgi:hypothetical protein